VTVAALMDARIGVLARQLRTASIPGEREKLAALLSALQAARDARHGLNTAKGGVYPKTIGGPYRHPSEVAVPSRRLRSGSTIRFDKR
jgi:hypothetical protein